MDITMVSPMDHFRTRRSRSPSLPWRPVALVPTARFWGLIIFPRTPPEELAPTVGFGLSPICWAVTFWRLAKRALEEVSEPVSATPATRSVGRTTETGARGRQRQPQGVGEARVVQKVGQAQNRGYRQDRQLELVGQLRAEQVRDQE